MTGIPITFLLYVISALIIFRTVFVDSNQNRHPPLKRQLHSGRRFYSTRRPMPYGVSIEEIINPDCYHKYIRPGMENDDPLQVNASIAVTSLDKISEADMEYTITFHLYQQWRDERLDKPAKSGGLSKPLTMDSSVSDRIWVPDTYMVNAQKSFIHDVTSRNGLITLYPNGTVLYVLRITSRVSCPMKLLKYPMDEQNCKLILTSWSFTDDNLQYRWYKEESCKDYQGSVTGMEGVVLQQFNITSCVIYTDSQTSMLGNYSRLVLSFGLKRNMLFFVMQTYFPSILLVILSWISFWINMSSVPARVALGATTVLSMTTLMIGVYGSGPRSTSDVKAIDYYVFGCYGFIFAALMEYAGAHFALRFCVKKANLFSERYSDKLHPTNDDCEHETDCATFGNMTEHCKNSGYHKGENNFFASDSYTVFKQRETNRQRKCSALMLDVEDEYEMKTKKILQMTKLKNAVEKIDAYSRALFPACFLIFNAAYWWIFLNMLG